MATEMTKLKGQDIDIKNVTAIEFNKLITEGNGQLVDIRTPNEFKAGHIEGAVIVDFYSSDYRANLDKLDKSKPIYIYCRSGSRSGKSIGLLKQLGFKEIVNLQRGIIDWQRNGYSLIPG